VVVLVFGNNPRAIKKQGINQVVNMWRYTQVIPKTSPRPVFAPWDGSRRGGALTCHPPFLARQGRGQG